MLYLTETDLTGIDPGEALELIEAVEAEMLHVAPCLADPSRLSNAQRTWVKVRLRRIARRWHDTAGASALSSTTHTAGPVSVSETYDTRQGHPGALWRSEIADFRTLCDDLAATSGAFTINMTGLKAAVSPLTGAIINLPEPESCP